MKMKLKKKRASHTLPDKKRAESYFAFDPVENNTINTDPGGSYTGNPDPSISDTPVQDADDL